MLSPPWVHPRRKLGSSVLIVGNRGRVPIVDGDRELWIEPGTVSLLPAGQIHFGSQSISAPAMYFWFHFTTVKPPVILPELAAIIDAYALMSAVDRRNVSS